MILAGQQFMCYHILSNVLILNKKVHIFGIKSSPLCSFGNSYDETPFHIFYKCDRIKRLWSDLVQYFENSLILLTLTLQAAIFGILDSAMNDSILKNNKVFIHHIYLYLNYTFINLNKMNS